MNISWENIFILWKESEIYRNGNRYEIPCDVTVVVPHETVDHNDLKMVMYFINLSVGNRSCSWKWGVWQCHLPTTHTSLAPRFAHINDPLLPCLYTGTTLFDSAITLLAGSK